MRGWCGSGDEIFSFARLGKRVPLDHPLRVIRGLADEVLARLSGRFSSLYAFTGRPSLLPGMLAARDACLNHRPGCQVDRKSRGQPARLCSMGHVLMENRNGLIVDSTLTHATGTAEREAALTMLDRCPSRQRITLGADKAYDVAGFIGELRARKVTPHIAVKGTVYKTGTRRSSAIDGRTTRHPGYEISLQCRKRIEEVFGWVKASAGLTRFKVKGIDKTKAVFNFFAAAHDLIRLPRSLSQPPA